MRSRVSRSGALTVATLGVLGSPFLISAFTSAQTPPTPNLPPLSASAVASNATGSTVAPPPQIVLNDPLLAPVPAAEKVLTSWKQALQNINARSVDLATAEQEVERAEGNWRTALSNALPTLTAVGQATQFLLKSIDFDCRVQQPGC